MLTRLKNGTEAACPDCHKPVTGQRIKYGQLSYDCDHCNTWGPWRDAAAHARELAALVAKAQGSEG